MSKIDIHKNASELVGPLKRAGYRFNSFSLTSQGRYAPEDAEWNYKDIPHLEHVHDQADAFVSVAQDELVSSIFMQKLFGFWLPLTIVIYKSDLNRQTYFTTFFFFIIIIESTWEPISADHTKVITNYSVGTHPVFFFLTRLVKWSISRNYKVLMSSDVPMRDRRGELRSMGYSFKQDPDKYSYVKSTMINEPCLIRPTVDDSLRTLKLNISEKLSTDQTFLLGRSDHYGVRIERTKGRLLIFPRMCPHEGAPLDNSPCRKETINCPWHGRTFAPLCTFDLTRRETQESKTDTCTYELTGDQLIITFKT